MAGVWLNPLLTSALMEVTGHLLTLATLPSGRAPLPTEKEPGYILEQAPTFWRSKKSPAPARNQIPDYPSDSTVTTPTELFQTDMFSAVGLTLQYVTPFSIPEPPNFLILNEKNS